MNDDLLNQFADQMDEFADAPQGQREGRGIKGVLGDIASGVASAPGSLLGWLAEAPAGVADAVMHPLRSSQDAVLNLGGALGDAFSMPHRIARYKDDITGSNSADDIPKAWDVNDLRRMANLDGESSRGGKLISDLILAGLTRGAGQGIQSMGVKSTAGSQALSAAGAAGLLGGNMAEGAALGSLAGVKIPRLVDMEVRRRADKSPLTAAERENIASQYEGMPVDVGTLVDDPFLKSVYEGLGKSPLFGRGVRKSKAKQSDMQNMNEWNEQLGNLEGELQASQRLDGLTDNVDSLLAKEGASPSIVGGLKEAYSKAKKTSDAMYKEFKDLELDLGQTVGTGLEGGQKRIGKGRKPAQNEYQSLIESLREKSKNLEELVGTDRALGAQVKNAIQEADNMMNAVAEGRGKIKFETAEHYIKSLREHGERLKQGRFDIGAQTMHKIANSLNRDLVRLIERQKGVSSANRLQEARRHHAEEIAPFYESEVTRNVVKDGKTLSKDPLQFFNSLNEKGRQALYKMSPESKRSMAFELLTGGKGGSAMNPARSSVDLVNNFKKGNRQMKEFIKDAAPELYDILVEGSKVKRLSSDILNDIAAHRKARPKSTSVPLSAADLAGATTLLAGSGMSPGLGALGGVGGGAFARILRKSLENKGHADGTSSLYRNVPALKGAIVAGDRENEF